MEGLVAIFRFGSEDGRISILCRTESGTDWYLWIPSPTWACIYLFTECFFFRHGHVNSLKQHQQTCLYVELDCILEPLRLKHVHFYTYTSGRCLAISRVLQCVSFLCYYIKNKIFLWKLNLFLKIIGVDVIKMPSKFLWSRDFVY